MATEDEAREAADGTEVQVEAVDLGTVHLQAHPEVKLPSIMEIKNVGEITDSTEGTLKISEDQVLVEAPSEVELPPEHSLNGKASSLNGHLDKQEKISSEQPHENNKEDAELDGASAHQSNEINKEEVTDGLSHGESTTEDRSLLKHEKDEEPRDDQQDSEGVTVDDELVQEDTPKTDGSVEQTDDGQRDQNQEPEKANGDTQPVSIANDANAEEAEAPTALLTTAEPHLDDSTAVPETIDEKTETEEPVKEDGIVHPDHKESFPEDASSAEPAEDVVKLEDQQSQQADAMDADVVPKEVPKSDHVVEEPRDDQQDSEGVTVDDELAQEDTPKTDGSIEQTDDGQQDQNQEPEKANRDTQPASIANDANAEEAGTATGLLTTVEPHLDDSAAVPETTDEKTETGEPAKADDVVHPVHKESFTEDASISEPAEEVVKLEDQHSQQADGMDADVVPKEVPKSEHVDEPATDAHEVLNQESTEETDGDGPVNEKTEETTHHSSMAAPEETAPEHDTTTSEPPVNIQVQNQESLEEIEDAEAGDTEAAMQQSSVAYEEAIPEDQHNLGTTMDGDAVEEDTLEAVEQKEGSQQDQDLGPENATENAQPASMANIPDVEVVAEAPSGVQTPLEINLDNSDAIPGTADGNTETDESAKADGAISENTSIAEPIVEVVKVEDRQSQQADVMDADLVKEEVPKSENTEEPMTYAQEFLNQESAEETDGPVNEKTEETEYKSNMAVPEETMLEHDAQMRDLPVNNQVQNQESLEEIEDTEAEMQQSSVAFEETTTEPCSETQHVHHVEPEVINAPGDAKDEEVTNKSNTENAVQDNILQSGPPTDIQPDQELEQTESKSTGTYTMDVASGQIPAVVFNDLAEEGATATPPSEPQVTETEEELKDTEAQELTTPSKELSAEDDSTAHEPHNDDIQQSLEQDSIEVKVTVSTSEEDTVEDNVTAEEPTSDSQEVDNAESTEETKGNIDKNIAEASNVVIIDEAVEEQNVLRTEDIAETHMRELEPEETKNTEPVESEKASDQINAVLFNDLAQKDTPESEMQQTESATETETEAAPQESNACVSEELSPEDHMTESETNCHTQEVSSTESLEVTDGGKDLIDGGISGESNTVSTAESSQENNVPESEPTADIQPVQELEPEDVETKETSHEMNTTVFHTPTEEDNPATIELNESERELSHTEAENPHHSDAAQPEEQAPEEIESEPQVLEPESIEEINDTEATEPTNISQGNIISTSVESVPEEIATEYNTATEPNFDHQQLQDQEPTDFKETEADEPQVIVSSSTLITPEQLISEDNAAAKEPSSDTQAENPEPSEVTVGTENLKSNAALPEAADPEEHVETDPTTDTSPVQEPEPEEIKDAETAGTEDIMISSDLSTEKTDMETMGIEALPHDSHVETIKELTEDDTEPVLEQESVEDTKCTDTMEQPGEPHGSTSDEPTPTEENTTVTEPAFDSQVQNLASQEIKDSEDAKTDELSDLSSFPTPEETDQESNLPRTEPTPDVQQVQELGSTEETRDTEPMGTEDHQQHGVSTLEEPAVDSEPNVDDQQVHEDEVPEDKDNEAIEAEEVIQQSNIAIPDDETEERSELRSDPDSYVQPAQQVELSRDSENSQLVKAEETSGQVNAVTIEETHTEDSVESEIDPPVDIKQEHEQEPVEEIKGIDANVSEQFHISPVEAIEKSASEGNIASIEPTSDIKQENELEETKEINFTEAINDGEQTENATLEDPSPTDYETTSERHPAELNEETMGNETDSVMLVPGIKDEIQTSMEPKDNACDVTETVLTTQGSEDVADEDSVKSPDDDILETSNNIYQVKEEQKDGCEHNSTEMSGVQNEENIIHVQDRDISGGLLTKGGTEEASESLFESDPQGAQDDTKKDDNTEGGEQTSDLNRQPDDVALQLQTCEADALSTERQDEVVQKVDLDQQQKEDEEIESQKEEIQADEQKHEDKGGDFTMEPLVDPKDIENGATDRTEDTDACEAKQTETVITEVLKHEEAPHVSEESTPRSMDMETDIGKGTNEGTEEDADAKNDNEDEGESAEKDDMVAKDCTDEQDEITDEITNEELEPGLASSDQEASDPAPSTDGILENDLAAVTQNVESGEHSTEDKECTDKVNDDVHTIQASEEIADEINENKEIRNEDNDIHHDESQTKTEKEEAPQLLSDKPCDVDARINDTTTLGEEIIDDNASINPREIEEIGENKGLDSTSEPFVESSIQNKVEDEKLSMTEQNDVDIEEIADESSSDINQTKQHQEEINKDDVQQLEVEENSFDKIDETVSHEKTETSTTEVVTINDNVIDKASGDDVGPSDGSLKTFNDTEKDLDVSSVITASKEESVNENKEDHKLALPAHTTQNENTMEQAFCLEKTEREIPLSEKLLSTEPEENQIPTESNEEDLQDEDQISNEMNEEDMQDTEIGAQKEVEQDLPVSNFLMNLILGKMNGDANETSESEAEREQEETTEDDSCVLIPKQEEILGSLPTEDEVDGNLTLEQEKHDVKCSEETQEMAKEKSDDLELGTERSIHTDEELNKDTGDLEIPAYQGNSQDKISGELLSEETTSVSTKMQSRDIEISYLELDDKAVDTACQENAEASTKTENGSLDLTNTEASEEDTPGEEQTEPQHECLPGDKSADEVSEQMPLLTESGTIDAKDLSCDAEATQNLACAKEDELSESSIIEATSTPDIQLECEEVEKKEEEQHASTDTGKVSQEDEESSNDNLQKSTSSAVKSDEQAPQITEPVSDTEKISNHEKEISEGSTCMDEKENSNFSIKGVESFQTAVEIQADGSNMQTNQDKKDEVSDNKTAAELEKLGESDFQEHQETGTEQKSPKEDDEGDQQFLVEKEIMIKEQAVPGTVENHEQTMSVKSNEEQELLDSKVQERDLNVVSPREASEAEENFVDVTKPEFSTDEEQSPKADAEEKAYDEKIKEVEGTKNFTDGEAVKTEAPGATPKAHKKQNLLSGVGSKVKHQLAKVKKAIVGKPGRTKPESPKS